MGIPFFGGASRPLRFSGVLLFDGGIRVSNSKKHYGQRSPHAFIFRHDFLGCILLFAPVEWGSSGLNQLSLPLFSHLWRRAPSGPDNCVAHGVLLFHFPPHSTESVSNSRKHSERKLAHR